MLQKKIIIGLTIGLAILASSLWYAVSLSMKYKDKTDRFENNYIAAEGKANSNTDYLTTKEFKDIFKSEVDSLKKQIKGLKAKNVTSVTKNTYHYEKQDSSVVSLIKDFEDFRMLYMQDKKMPTLPLAYSDSCLSFSGNIDLNDGSFMLLSSSFDTKTTTVDYWMRNRVNLLFFKPKWGKKETYRETMDRCMGTVDTEQTNIIKRK